MNKSTERIRALNDEFRKTLCGGRVVLTQRVHELAERTKVELVRLIQTFDSFDASNDPYHEHDFLSVSVEGESYFAKIDYYDLSLQAGSENPADPEKTIRVLTIMTADEY